MRGPCPRARASREMVNCASRQPSTRPFVACESSNNEGPWLAGFEVRLIFKPSPSLKLDASHHIAHADGASMQCNSTAQHRREDGIERHSTAQHNTTQDTTNTSIHCSCVEEHPIMQAVDDPRANVAYYCPISDAISISNNG